MKTLCTEELVWQWIWWESVIGSSIWEDKSNNVFWTVSNAVYIIRNGRTNYGWFTNNWLDYLKSRLQTLDSHKADSHREVIKSISKDPRLRRIHRTFHLFCHKSCASRSYEGPDNRSVFIVLLSELETWRLMNNDHRWITTELRDMGLIKVSIGRSYRNRI